MWTISDQFKAALKAPHELTNTLTVTPPGGSPLTVPVKAGNISVDGNARIRRTAALTVYGDSTVYDTCSTPGAQFGIIHGLVMGATTEAIPVFTGELAGDAQQDLGDGEITLALGDLSNWLSRCRFMAPFAPGTITRVAAITAAVQTARPGTTVTNTSTDTGTVTAGTVWTGSALDVIADLSKDGRLECFFAPDGTYIIRDQQTLTASPIWTASAGAFGVIKTASRARPVDRLYNVVIVQPMAGTQTWTAQTAQISDTTHPRYPGKIGYVPYFWSSPTIQDAATALAVANQILSLIQGTSETLAIELIANPALEANDVIRVVTPQIGSQQALIFQHFMDSFNFDLALGSMTANTRSQVVLDA